MSPLRRSSSFLALVALAGWPVALRAQGGTYVLRNGKDTVAVERFSHTTGRYEAESFVPSAGARQKMVVEVGPDARVSKLTSDFWMMADSAGREPRQTATMTFVGDSVIAAVSGGGRNSTNRIKTTAGAVPYANPSMVLIGVIIERAGQTHAATVPVFVMAGGQTIDATVRRIGADSVVVTLGSGEMRLKVGPDGRLEGGTVGNLTLELAAGPVVVKAEKPDYSAPAGATYTAIAVTVPTPMGHTLAGTLTLPKGASREHPVPAIVTITGSGLEDRDEALPIFKGYRPFRQIADTLTRRGIAVLRMDDRGFGESGGNGGTATSADFAQDIRAGLAYLRTRPEIDAGRLGLVGHSEGGLIAPLVAKQEPTLKAIVLLAGTAYTGRKILLFQLRNGIQQSKDLPAGKRDSLLAQVPAQIDSMAAHQPWLKFFVDYDPLTTARVVKTPVLILNGATDQQVTPDQVPLLEQAFKSAGNSDVTAKIFPAMNHLFTNDPNGFPGGYASLPSIRVEPEVLGTVADWLAKRLRPQPIP